MSTLSFCVSVLDEKKDRKGQQVVVIWMNCSGKRSWHEAASQFDQGPIYGPA